MDITVLKYVLFIHVIILTIRCNKIIRSEYISYQLSGENNLKNSP